MTKHELLKYAVSKGIIDLSALETQVEDMERKRYLEMHRFEVWKDSNPRVSFKSPVFTRVSGVDCFDE